MCHMQERQLSLSSLCTYLPWHPRFTSWLTFLKNPSIMPLGIFLVSEFLYKSICCGYSFELHQKVDAIQMGTHSIYLYKKVDKKYTACNLKTMKLFDCVLIGVCAVIRWNTVFFSARWQEQSPVPRPKKVWWCKAIFYTFGCFLTPVIWMKLHNMKFFILQMKLFYPVYSQNSIYGFGIKCILMHSRM